MTRAADVSTQAVSAGFITAGSAANAWLLPTHNSKRVIVIINVSKPEVFPNFKAIAHQTFPGCVEVSSNQNGF
jgi:hypothetical protein